MPITKIGIDLICSFEGFKAEPYPDPATGSEPITIGYGTTHYPDGTKVTMADNAVTEEQAKTFIEAYVNSHIAPILDPLTLNEYEYGALASLGYNIGAAGLKDSTVLRLVKEGNYHTEQGKLQLSNAFKMWDKAAGKVNAGLLNRRNKEAIFFFS